MSNKVHEKYPPSVQHGRPRLTSLKNGWSRVSIGNLVLEVNRPVTIKDDETYLLVTAKRSRGGIVKRGDLNGRDIAVKSQFYIREGDFLISKRQIVHGACGFVPKELDGAIVSNEYLVLNFTNKITPKFWDFISHTIYFQQVCFHSSIGVHVEKMLFRVAQWYQWKINIPNLQEQEKIASFLGSIDTRLTQLRRKHELLQTYKRGVMQKIFSQKLRFKDETGSDFPDWEKKKLGELGEVISGLTYSPSDIRKEGLLVLRSSNIQNRRITFDDCVFVNTVVGSESLSREDDILICVRNGSTNLIGKNALIPKDIPLSTHGAFMVVFRGSRNKFVFQLFQTNAYKKQVCQDLGARINSINSNRLRKYKFSIPCIEEQDKIASFLTAIDQKLEVVAQQIDQTEQFKKSLLQKMFG